MQNDHETLLKVEHLCQYFRMEGGELKAVDNVSFEIKKGEVFGLVGESGCGKTTTGRSIIKLYNITSGNVWFKGVRIAAGIRSYQNAIKQAKADYAASGKTAEDKAKLDAIVTENKAEIKKAKHDQAHCDKEYMEARVKELEEEYSQKLAAASGEEKTRLEQELKKELYKAKHTRLVTRIQMIFQDPIASLNPRMTVREIIAEGLIIQGEKDQKLIDEKVYEMLELVGLVREHASRYPHEFSGGQRQRIGVARAIIMNPDLIIADEPVSMLDVSVRADIINMLLDLAKKNNTAVIFISHDIALTRYISDHIAVMYLGRVVEYGETDDVIAHPRHPYTRVLISHCADVDPDQVRDSLPITGEPPTPINPGPGCYFEPRCFKACPGCKNAYPGRVELGNGHYAYCSCAQED